MGKHNWLGLLGPDQATLVLGNWLHTAAWTLRAVHVVLALSWFTSSR